MYTYVYNVVYRCMYKSAKFFLTSLVLYNFKYNICMYIYVQYFKNSFKEICLNICICLHSARRHKLWYERSYVSIKMYTSVYVYN